MPGFFISNATVSPELADYNSSHIIQSEIKVGEYCVKRNTLDRFLDDKVFYQDDEYVIITEGVILNKSDLIKRFDVTSLVELIIVLYKEKGSEFFSDFRGPFSGAFYDKQRENWTVWTNQTGESAVFYYLHGGGLLL